MCFVPKLRALFQHLNFQKCPRPSVFNAFDFEMCFAPQRRALFRHLNFKKCSECAVLSIFWLRDVLRAAATCTFSTSQLLKKCSKAAAELSILTLKCLWRQNDVCFFRHPTSKSALKLKCFLYIFDFKICFAPLQHAVFLSLIWPDGSAPAALASLLFDPPEPQIIGKNTVSRLPHIFARLHLLSSDFLFSDLLSSSLLFSDPSHLCFSFVHIVGNLIFKLPSTRLAMKWELALWYANPKYHKLAEHILKNGLGVSETCNY